MFNKLSRTRTHIFRVKSHCARTDGFPISQSICFSIYGTRNIYLPFATNIYLDKACRAFNTTGFFGKPNAMLLYLFKSAFGTWFSIRTSSHIFTIFLQALNIFPLSKEMEKYTIARFYNLHTLQFSSVYISLYFAHHLIDTQYNNIKHS